MESSAPAQPLSFDAQMEIEEQKYAALMAQAKSSLARIKKIGEGFDKVQENRDAREGESSTRTKDLLSRIEAEAELRMGEEMEAAQGNLKLEEEDHAMEGNEEIDRKDHIEEDVRMEGNVEMEIVTSPHPPLPALISDKPEGSDFPELMERAKKLLAGISMGGGSRRVVSAGSEVPEAKKMWTEEESDAFWKSM